ncbi:hypothetical protein JTB14_028211 [Gonioctena quinquepunctata]|nr:hypothetical protein JTB14_028211 [Gonioctena quinquepunctata]
MISPHLDSELAWWIAADTYFLEILEFLGRDEQFGNVVTTGTLETAIAFPLSETMRFFRIAECAGFVEDAGTHLWFQNYHLWTKKMNEVVVGIDLGTTFSCVAVYKGGKPEVIPDRNGDRLIPSIVYFEPETGDVLVGRIADEKSPECPENCLKDSKRILGRKFDDEFIAKYRKQKDTQFSIVRGDNDNAMFQLRIRSEFIRKTPEEVSAEILKYLKTTATEYLGKYVKEAVISIPAYFSNAQRKATKKAADLAGLKLLKFITEPCAGALHYKQGKIRDSKLLVFDWGGGTLDVSLIQVKNKIFEVKSVYGDTLLGGRNIDHVIFDYFHRPIDSISKKFIRRLQRKCEKLKRDLSTLSQSTIYLECYDGANDLKLSLTRNEFVDLTEDIFQRAINIVEYGIADTGWKISQVYEVILVGGSTRIPKIRNLLERVFGKEKLKTDLNPDEAVALGACIQAAMLKDEFADAEKFKITEVTPLSLGLGHTLMTTVIERNTSLPTKSSVRRQTRHNNQESVVFQIYEGERKNTIYNNKLGELRLTGLPHDRAGDVEFSVTFNLDEDGILTVTAIELSTGNRNKLVVTLGEFRLSERKVKLSVEDAAKHKYEDDVFEAYETVRTELVRKCNHILYDLTKIPTESDRFIVRKKCQKFLDFSENLDFTEIVELEKKFKSCYESISPILKENSMHELTYQ